MIMLITDIVSAGMKHATTVITRPPTNGIIARCFQP